MKNNLNDLPTKRYVTPILVATHAKLTIKPYDSPHKAVDWFPISIAKAMTATK